MRHPSFAARFEWDENKESKLAQRGIYAEDVEYVFENEPTFLKNKRSGSARWLMDGRDRSGAMATHLHPMGGRRDGYPSRNKRLATVIPTREMGQAKA